MLLGASTLLLASLVLQAPPTPPAHALQFIVQTSSQKKHTTVVHEIIHTATTGSVWRLNG